VLSASVRSARAPFRSGVEFLIEHGRRELALRLAGQLDQLADARGDLLAALVAEFDGAQTSASETCCAPASTITMPPSVPATTMFSFDSRPSV
jgi:hypothetical protein